MSCPATIGFAASPSPDAVRARDRRIRGGTVEILDGYGNRSAERRAERAQTLPRPARRDEVDRIQTTMTGPPMAEVDREMEKAVRQHLLRWLL